MEVISKLMEEKGWTDSDERIFREMETRRSKVITSRHNAVARVALKVLHLMPEMKWSDTERSTIQVLADALIANAGSLRDVLDPFDDGNRVESVEGEA